MQPLPMTPDMLPILMAGFGLGFSLILAIGAQNAFVLRQGIRGQHVLPIVLTCALSDALQLVLDMSPREEVDEPFLAVGADENLLLVARERLI